MMKAARRARQRPMALYVALQELNLGEDSGVEHKMVRRRWIHHLASILTHATCSITGVDGRVLNSMRSEIR